MTKKLVGLALFSAGLALCAGAAEVLAALDGAAANATRLEAAKARPYKGGFSLDGEDVVCTVTADKERTGGAGWSMSLNQKVPASVSSIRRGQYLHSTMVRLKDVSRRSSKSNWRFTFHYGQIKSSVEERTVDEIKNLHSTMVRLKGRRRDDLTQL